MGDLIARLRRNATLAEAASLSPIARDSSFDRAPFTVVARSSSGAPVVVASRPRSEPGLSLWMLDDAGSLSSAALLSALNSDGPVPVVFSELDPRTIPTATLRRWERAAPVASPSGDAPSSGRWFWLVAIALLGLEWIVRRRQDDSRGLKVDAAPLTSAEDVRHVA
jgi:hypothetical protein